MSSSTAVDRHSSEDGGWGPTRRGGRRRGAGVWARRILVVVLVLLLVVVLTALAVLLYASSQITRIPVDNLGSDGPLHVLVVGSDSREGLSEEERQELSTGSATGERTDTIFVMTLAGGRVGMLAFPRDLYVSRCDGSEGRINVAMAVGGPGCLVKTVSDLSGIAIDHYLSIDFLGFRDVVNAVGGVRVCLDKPIADDDAGIDLPQGCQILNGANALGYVRVRKIDSDLERIKRQQTFLNALAQKVISPGTVTNVPRLFDTSGEIGGALTADEGLGPFDLLRLGWGMRGLADGAYVTHTVPAAGQSIGGAAVLVPVDEEARPLFEAYRTGSILSQASGRGPAPEEIDVAVMNGAGISGLAGRTADALEAQGFTVTEVGNADPTDRTVVRHPAGQKPAAEVVAGALPVDPVLEEAEVGVVTVVLGRDLATAGG